MAMPVMERFDIADLVTFSVIAVVILVLVASIAPALRPRRRRRVSEGQYNAELLKRRLALEELPYPLLNQVVLPGSRGAVLKVDQVIRLPASVLLVTSAPADVSGQVLANSNAGQWRYINSQGRISRMQNPVIALRPLIHAIRTRFPMVRIRLLTVFPDSADFRGRPPRGCCLSGGVIAAVRAMAADDGAASAALDEAWETLSAALKLSSSEAG